MKCVIDADENLLFIMNEILTLFSIELGNDVRKITVRDGRSEMILHAVCPGILLNTDWEGQLSLIVTNYVLFIKDNGRLPPNR